MRTDETLPQSSRRAAASATTLLAAALALTGCTGGLVDQGIGGGLVTISGDDVAGGAVPFEGELLLDHQSCMLARLTTPAGGTTDRWVVWPTGAEHCTNQEDAGSPESREGAVIDGERFVNGERVRGTGYVVGLEALPGEGRPSGGTYAERGRYCDAQDRGVLVIAEVEHT